MLRLISEKKRENETSQGTTQVERIKQSWDTPTKSSHRTRRPIKLRSRPGRRLLNEDRLHFDAGKHLSDVLNPYRTKKPRYTLGDPCEQYCFSTAHVLATFSIPLHHPLRHMPCRQQRVRSPTLCHTSVQRCIPYGMEQSKHACAECYPSVTAANREILKGRHRTETTRVRRAVSRQHAAVAQLKT